MAVLLSTASVAVVDGPGVVEAAPSSCTNYYPAGGYMTSCHLGLGEYRTRVQCVTPGGYLYNDFGIWSRSAVGGGGHISAANCWLGGTLLYRERQTR